MVIEQFKPGKRNDVYDRYHKQGRMLSEGLEYIASWLEEDGDRCFQLMRAEGAQCFEEWTSKWKDWIDFEIVPLEPSPTNTSNKFLSDTLGWSLADISVIR